MRAILCWAWLTTLAGGVPDAPRWVAAWTAPPDQAGTPLAPLTVRQVVRLTAQGTRLRVRLSNAYGTGPLRIGSVHVGLPAGGSAIRPGSDRGLTFGGRPGVTVPQGGSVLSDPLDQPVEALQDLTVSLHLPEPVPAPTLHGVGLATAHLVPGRDLTAALRLPPGPTDDSRYFLSDVEVEGTEAPRAFVAFGDSITDGVGSALEAHGRWTDRLAERLRRHPGLNGIAVLNAGIAGNRLLKEEAEPFVGPSGLARFERDVLDKPGVRWVLLLTGGNDLSANGMLADPAQHATSAEVIGGLKVLAERARARGLRVWAGTATPRGGAAKPFRETPAIAAERDRVRSWIRTSGVFDAVIDFEEALRDPAHPDRLRPEYDSGDHVHPNEAGYRAMAGAIDLGLFRSELKALP